MKAVGVTLKDGGKVYYFAPGNFELKKNITVIVETENGLQFGKVVELDVEVKEERLKNNCLKNVVRIANKRDYADYKKNLDDAKEAAENCQSMADKLSLSMKVIDAYYTFNRNQLVFRFLAENRVDFRELVKKLAVIYKTRIEMRQVGVRDKAREIGGLGLCGRPLCCSTYCYDFDSVSINMAKNQSLSLNPNKINGACGRLLCCLKYEDDLYEENRGKLPNIGEYVKVREGKGIVKNIDILNLSYLVEVKDVGIVEVKL
ncbi:MAG: regulatory iron-sulfur-containing complex subunit RicT [Bacilli bacterium]|nr:regulatory iron-sulfur-containing complex subunit RicT [Bacilli bacterium]